MDLAGISLRLSRILPSDYRLSDHFIVPEFSCRHCGRVYITPPLLVMLEKLRSLANVPLTINSGYRCPTHNRDIGGAPHSKHCLGMAVDIDVPDKYSDNLDEFLEMVESVVREVHGGWHYYPAGHFIHMDCWQWPPDRRW